MLERLKHEEYLQELKNDFNHAKIAGSLSMVFVLSSVVFPPAIGGAWVCAAETGRNVIKMNLKVIKYHSDKDA